jgi:hypothetical protein
MRWTIQKNNFTKRLNDMGADIIVERGYAPETCFPIHSRVLDLVCDAVGQSADRLGYMEVSKLCIEGKADRRLLLLHASQQVKTDFKDILRELLNNGTIIKEMLSWPTPLIDTSPLLPENCTPDVISFISTAGTISTLRRLTIYLDRFSSDVPPT